MDALKKIPSTFLRALIGGGIIFYLFYKMDMRGMLSVLRDSLHQWPWLLCGVLLCLAGLCIGIVRWRIILEARGLRMPWPRVFCVYFIGHFFNAFMFGSTGGDLARGFYAAKETHHKKTEAIATVLIDRMIGITILNLIALVMLIARAGFYLHHWVTHVPALIMLAINLLTFAVIIITFNAHRFKNWPVFRRITAHPRMGPQIKRLLISIYLYRRKKDALLKTALLSLAIHLLIVIQCYCLGRSFQIHLSLIAYLTVVPIIMAIAAMPITPGGLGIREGLTVALFGTLGIDGTRSLPLSVMVYISALIWSLVGGLIFLGYSTGSGRTPQEELRNLRDEAASMETDLGVARPHKEHRIARTDRSAQ